MIEKKDIVEPQTVACQLCLKEIPKSVAESAEGVEYVYYFCGADCYEQWREQEAPTESATRKEP